MKPIHTTGKSNGFSIDSLIRTDNNETCSSTSGSQRSDTEPNTTVIPSRIPPLHPALPPHVRNLLLADQVAQQSSHTDLLNFQRSAWAFQNGPLPSVSSFTRGLAPPVSSMQLHPTYPNFLQAQRDQLNVYPWLMSRNSNGLFGLPFGK